MSTEFCNGLLGVGIKVESVLVEDTNPPFGDTGSTLIGGHVSLTLGSQLDLVLEANRRETEQEAATFNKTANELLFKMSYRF